MNANYANTESSFAKVVVGEWLTSKVSHVFQFTKNTYLNTVTCVKPHTNRQLIVGKDEGSKNMYNFLAEGDDAS